MLAVAARHTAVPSGVGDEYSANVLHTLASTRLAGDADIDNSWGLAGDAWDIRNGPHLSGHPIDKEIFHWYAINWYDGSSGSGTDYADSVYGSQISWAKYVPRYTINFSSSTITTINGGRGYVW